jgi:hypothetical protein
MKKILLILMLYSFNALSQGALVIKRFEEVPTNQWFMFAGKRHGGSLIYHGTPPRVESEVFKVLDYYLIDHKDLKLSDDVEEFIYTVNKKYRLYIYITEVDQFEWTRTVYLLIRK